MDNATLLWLGNVTWFVLRYGAAIGLGIYIGHYLSRFKTWAEFRNNFFD
ncbi:hypothetical protein [Levilactobacillus acidifarinae]|nr:hypothetical protein [Levilactobacillus acidifarinae]GEO70473.1 hypothetical protein LAC03_23830 [Levilactobacillus acidifarinae]